jgi:hypothetical protein
MRRLLAVGTLLTVSVLGANDAQAIRIRSAHFNASLSGTYTTSAQITEGQCFVNGPNDELVPIAPVTTNASDRVGFSSVRPTRIAVEEFDRPPLAVGSLGRQMSIRVSATRSSGLSSQGRVPGCTPGAASDPTAHCGTRRHTYPGDVIGAIRGSGLGFAFVRRGHFVVFPGDLFDTCVLGPGQLWFGKLSILTAPVSTAKLFNRHRHTVVVVGGRSGRRSVREGNQTAVVTFTERFTLTLRRTG